MYDTGSYWAPLNTPPLVSSCGVMVLHISRAGPPRRRATAAACWCGWRSVTINHSWRSCTQARNEYACSCSGFQAGGWRALKFAPPPPPSPPPPPKRGIMWQTAATTAPMLAM
eukprot:9476542-Alexandrium_andersonii.AAC.1